jgi:sortase A
MLGRVTISRLNMSAVVLEGVDSDTLRRSAGHVPSTALPGEVGNFSIAAHRDTLFRPLKDIRVGDEVQFATPQKNLLFRVVSTKIVKPTDVSILDPQGDSKLLTMITCYPFYYIGSAPQRFIVTARLEPQTDAVAGPSAASASAQFDSRGMASATAPVHRRLVAAKQVTGRGFLPAGAVTDNAATGTGPDTQPKKQHGVWSRLVRAYHWLSDRLD